MSRNHFFAAAYTLAFVAGNARSQSEASALSDLSALPIASVATGAHAALAVPAVLSAGAVFVVKSVAASAYANLYTLERVSDGARVNVEIAARGAMQPPVRAGMTVMATVLNTGVVLAAGSQPIAFVPNALGRALLHKEGVTL